MLIDQIKAALLEARKARNAAAAASLSTLVGECETLSKAGKGDLTDAIVVTVVKKFLKNLQESLTANQDRGNQATVEELAKERRLYEQFLPKQLTETELSVLIDGMLASGAKDIGDCMKLLKTEHAGTYDGATASKLLKLKFSK